MSEEEESEGPTARKRRRLRRWGHASDAVEGGCCLLETVTAVAVIAAVALPVWHLLS